MNWKAYKLGQEDCKFHNGEMDGYANPYEPETESRISYRKGWNEYWDESWKGISKAETLINVDCMDCGKSKAFCKCEN